MDRGAWWAIVHRVTQSRTQLKQLSGCVCAWTLTHTCARTCTHTHTHTHTPTRAFSWHFPLCLYLFSYLSLPFYHYTFWVWCVSGFCFNKAFLTFINFNLFTLITDIIVFFLTFYFVLSSVRFFYIHFFPIIHLPSFELTFELYFIFLYCFFSSLEVKYLIVIL